jgi:hypothetical protein
VGNNKNNEKAADILADTLLKRKADKNKVN